MVASSAELQFRVCVRPCQENDLRFRRAVGGDSDLELPHCSFEQDADLLAQLNLARVMSLGYDLPFLTLKIEIGDAFDGHFQISPLRFGGYAAILKQKLSSAFEVSAAIVGDAAHHSERLLERNRSSKSRV